MNISGLEAAKVTHQVEPCWGIDAGAPGEADFSVNLILHTDASGTVKAAEIAPQDIAKMGDPIFSTYAQRSVAAFLDYQCATLPLPQSMLGAPQTINFQFKPGG